MTKACIKCKVEKVLSVGFYKHQKTRDGYAHICKDCHRIVTRISQRKLRALYPEKHNERMRKWRRENPERTKLNNNKARQKLRMMALERYGAICKCCDEDEQRFLTIDHINNDGAEHRKTLKYSIYLWLKQHNYPKGFQILCFNCNLAKEFDGVCPHKSKNTMMNKFAEAKRMYHIAELVRLRAQQLKLPVCTDKFGYCEEGQVCYCNRGACTKCGDMLKGDTDSLCQNCI